MLRYGYAFDRDTSLIEDCVHELFIELWQKRDRIGDTTSIKNYLLVSIKRKIWSKQKAKKRKKFEVLENDQFIDFDLNIEAKMIEGERMSEQMRLLLGSVDQLSSRQREIIYLKYHEDLDYEGICEVMDMSYQSARNLLSTALGRLKKLMLGILFLIFSLL